MLAAEAVAHDLAPNDQPVDLLLAFASGRHANELGEISAHLRRELAPGVALCVSGESLVASDQEIERTGALSAIAFTLPGTTLRPFRYQDLHQSDPGDSVASAREAIGASDALRAVLFFADPFSVPATTVVPDLSLAARASASKKGQGYRPIIGGLASASTSPGGNTLVLNDQIMRAGGVGVSISGDVRVDTIVSQGCRPIGKNFVITEGERNVIRKLGGRPAMKVLQEVLESASPHDQTLLKNGLLVGRAVNEYQERFGRGDFLIRNIMGADAGTGVIAIGDSVRVGQTIRFHVRDATTANEDLALLLDAEQVRDPAIGGLLVSCNSRGTRLFSSPNHDASIIAGRLPSTNPEKPLPLAGFFAAGEIGPIGGPSFVHGHAACCAVFRPPIA